jgi:hypothetical protein
MNDYVDAAERLFLSAEALEHAAQPATASHCYGISSECVLKALMSNQQPQATPISTDHLGSKLWSSFATSPALSTHPNRVTLAKQFETCFSQWTLHQRYFHRNDPAFHFATVSSQKQGAAGLRSLLQQVQQGLI